MIGLVQVLKNEKIAFKYLMFFNLVVLSMLNGKYRVNNFSLTLQSQVSTASFLNF